LSDVPFFAGNKSNNFKFQDWLNQLALYNGACGILDDQNKILYALTRVTDHAATFLQSYHHLLNENKSLGTWEEFVNRMTAQFGTRDIKVTAQQELLKLWSPGAANGDFIAYAEKYRTAAQIAEGYSDATHISSLKQIVPQALLNGMIAFEVLPDPNVKSKFDTWEKYLDLLVQIYKYMNPDKVKGSLFKGSSQRDPNAMDTSTTEKKQAKGKGRAQTNTTEKKHCGWCKSKGKQWL
jgi:hypothetical protein